MPITHAFVNGKADGADATVTRPSDWNANHTVTADSALPGYEFDYVENASSVVVSATSPTFASATALVTGNAVTYDGSTVLILEFNAVDFRAGATAGDYIYVVLYDGSTEIGHVAFSQSAAAANDNKPCHGMRRYTPSAGSHTFAARSYKSGGNGQVTAGAGGASQSAPMFLRVTRAA